MKKTKTGALTNPKTVIFATQLLRCKVDIAIFRAILTCSSS